MARLEQAEFDAQVLRVIFGMTKASTEFIAAGSSNDVLHDSSKIVGALRLLLPGVSIIRVVDRDCFRNATETAALREQEGVSILSVRDIENYLWDDELLVILCDRAGRPESAASVLQRKAELLAEIGDSPADDCADVKRIAAALWNHVRQTLRLTESGSN